MPATALTIDDVVPVSAGAGTTVAPPVDGYHVLSARWEEVEHRVFGGDAESYFGGFWTGEPGAVRFDAWPYDEICVVLKGRVAVVDQTGRRKEFGAGEAFFVPQGLAGDWVTVEPSAKVFVAVSR
ncbi:cupin domain-containing protein [Blastococcus sp. SYSU D00669]